MIEGITVLNQEMIMTTPNICAVLGIIGIICSIISFVLMLGCLSKALSVISGFFCILGIVITFICAVQEVETDRYKYECTIDPQVSFADIYENYEIVEQRGEIWVLADKNKED